MIVAIAKLGDVLVEMAQSHAMVLPEDAAFQQPPKGFDSVCVNFAVGIANLVIDDLMRHEVLDAEIPGVFIGDEYSVSNVHVVAHHLGKTHGFQFGFINGSRNDPSATFYHSDHGRFVGSASTLVHPPAWGIAFSGFAADIALIHFHDALEQFALLEHRISDTHSHEPRGIPVHFQIAGQLPSGDAFLGIQDEREGKKPLLQVQMGMMEDCVNSHAERGITAVAMMPSLGLCSSGADGFAVWTDRLSLPADTLKMSNAISLGREFLVN